MRRDRDSNPPTFALFSGFRRNPYGLEIYTARRLATGLDTTHQGKFKMQPTIIGNATRVHSLSNPEWIAVYQLPPRQAVFAEHQQALQKKHLGLCTRY